MSVRSAVRLGAVFGASLALAYGLVFIVFAVLRYGSDLRAAPPEGGFWPTVAGGAVSLAVASLGITAIMALVAAIIGTVTALCAAALYWLVKQRSAGVRPAAIGVGVAILFVLILHFALWQIGLWSLPSSLSTTYLFWLGVPALVYVMAAVPASRAYSAQVAGQVAGQMSA